jgi:hypothetical protein
MNKVAIAVVVLLAGGFGYWLWSHKSAPPPPPPPPLVVDAAPRPRVVDAQAAPVIQHPIERVSGRSRPSRPIPGLDDSDAAMQDGLNRLLRGKRLGELLFLEGIIRRFVATVDSLPREQVSPVISITKPVQGALEVDSASGGYSLSARNAARYTTRLKLAESVNIKKLVTLYVDHYQLFQQAYQELGYPTGYFNDRLIEAIDNMLATPDPRPPIRLVQPKVRYEFADPDLQRRSAGQKMLLRMGPEHAARVKVILREIRNEVTGHLQ